MSDRLETSKQPHKSKVFKSHEVAGLPLELPVLEQIAMGDLPPSLSAFRPEPGMPHVGGQAWGLVEAVRQADLHKASEEKIKALERRASAVLEEAEEMAHSRRTDAEQQVQEMLTRAAEAVANLEAQARESGHATGYNEGYEAGLQAGNVEAEVIVQGGRDEAESLVLSSQAEADAIMAEAQQDAENARAEGLLAHNQMLVSAKEQILDLAFALARQVLRAEITLQPPAFLPMVEAALSKLKGEDGPQVRVHPEFLAMLNEQRGRLLAALPGARRIDLDGDPGMVPGDFVVQGNQGIVDGRLERQMQVLEESLRQERD